MSDQPRVLFDRYTLLSVLGSGGMGQVWLAEDEVLHRQVAVKEIRFPADLPVEERELLRQRTLREARLTARLSHPGIITVHDVVSDHGSPYIVMELVRAPSLAAALDMEGPLPPQRVAEIGLRLLDALDAAHAAGITHRDVKPSNVLLDGARVVLSDFGIATSSSDATLTTTGMVLGSPTYMSPERLRSEGVGPSGDLWSLGATLYAALEGHPPFRAENVMGTITAVLVDPPDPPSVTGPLREAVLGLLEKSPEERLGSKQVRRLLEQAQAEPAPRTPDVSETPPMPVMAPAVEEPHPAPAGWHATPAPATAPDARVREPTGRGQRPGRLALLGGLALAVLLVALTAFVIVRAGEDETPPAEGAGDGGGAGRPAATDPTTGQDDAEPTASSDEADADVPAGFRLVRDPLDFTVAVPEGWQRRLDGATRVDFVSPDGSQFLRVDQRAQAGSDAEQAWLDAEPSLADSLPGYSRISIEPLDFRGWEAADWEFTWDGESGTVHVLNRGFITDPRGFALYMSGPDESWTEDSLPVFEVAAETFEPSS